MKIWILNLVGVSLFGILIDILLPNGNTSKYIKGVLSLVLIYVIISPLVSIFSNYKSGNIKNFINNDYQINYDFVDELNIKSNHQEEKMLEEELTREGINGVKINIISNVIQQNKIEYVKVNLKNLVIDNESLNINIKDKITKIICARLKIKENKVYYE